MAGKVLLSDSHLSSAITGIARKLLINFKNDPDHTPSVTARLAQSCPIDTRALEIDSEKLYGVILQDVYTSNDVILPWVERHLSQVYYEVKDHISKHSSELQVDPSVEYPHQANEKHKKMYSVKYRWESLRIVMQAMKRKRKLHWIKVTPPSSIFIEAFVSQSYCILRDDQDQYWLLDYDQVMMISDTCASRIFCLIYSDLLPSNIPGRVESCLIQQIYTIFDKILINKGNDTYKEIKNYEAIVQGVMLKLHDPLLKSADFLGSLVKDMSEEKYEGCLELVQFLLDIALSPEQLADLHGLYRHWGHPTVDEVAGCHKVRSVARNRNPVDIHGVKKMRALMKRQICMSFISKHGRWPKIKNIVTDGDCQLLRVIRKGNTCLNLYSPIFPLKHWDLIQFDKEFDFDYHLDFTYVCDDKAISVYLQDLPTIYSKETLGYDPGVPKSSRRVLLEMLAKNQIDIPSICEKVMSGNIPDNWKIVLVHAKEREMKIEPRLFAMMVLEMRI